MFFFLLWPVFARAPRHWFLENFLLSAPGVQSVFFFVALRWAPRPFGGARAKKKTPPRVFFFCSGPGERQGKEKPGVGQGVFFFVVARFCSCPASLVSRKFFAVGPGCAKCFFFCCAPLGAATFRPCLSPGPEQKKKKHLGGVCFLLWPRAGAQRGFSFPCLSPGPQQKKKTPWVVFFFALAPCRQGA